MVPHFFLASLEQPDRVRETPAALLTPRPRLSFPDTGRLQLMRQFMPPSSPEAITRQRHALTQPQLGNKHPVEPQQHTQRVLELRADASNNHTTAVSSLLMPPPHRRRRAFLRALGKVFRAQQDAPFLRDAIYMCLAFFVLCTMMSEALLQRTLPGGTMALLFEITSAFGTVGYSMGNGHDLAFSALFPPGGKAVIIILMLLGRLRGPLLLVIRARNAQGIARASAVYRPDHIGGVVCWRSGGCFAPSQVGDCTKHLATLAHAFFATCIHPAPSLLQLGRAQAGGPKHAAGTSAPARMAQAPRPLDLCDAHPEERAQRCDRQPAPNRGRPGSSARAAAPPTAAVSLSVRLFVSFSPSLWHLSFRTQGNTFLSSVIDIRTLSGRRRAPPVVMVRHILPDLHPHPRPSRVMHRLRLFRPAGRTTRQQGHDPRAAVAR